MVIPILAAVAPATDIVVTATPEADLTPEMVAHIREVVRQALAGRPVRAASVLLTLGRLAITIEAGGISDRIDVASWDDVALRTVALHVVDLLQPAPEFETLGAQPAVTAVAPAPPAAPRPASRPWWIRARGALGGGTAGTDPRTYDAAIGAVVGWGRIRTGLSAGWEHAPQRGTGSPTEASYDAWPLHLEAAALVGPVELGLRGGAAVYRVDARGPIWSATPLGGLFGGIRLPVNARATATLGGGVDLFTHRTTLTIGPDVVYSTPRVAAYAGITLDIAVVP